MEPRQIRALLDTLTLDDPHQRDLCAAMVALCARPGCLSRATTTPGHFTASAFVLSPDGAHLALIRHPKLGLWLQPGGHLEPEDADPESAARREVAEELGLGELRPLGLVDLDIHDIPARPTEPAHQHFDLRFGFVSSSNRLDGEHEAQWVALTALDGVQTDASVRRGAARLSGRLARGR